MSRMKWSEFKAHVDAELANLTEEGAEPTDPEIWYFDVFSPTSPMDVAVSLDDSGELVIK
jgi:hypothetical protein